MKFLIGLAIGGGVGYVLGTAAGRERFDEIVASLEGVLGEETMQQVTDLLDQGTSEIRKAASEGLDKASDVVEAAASDDGDAG
jgi:tryptophan synthase beta subunit